MENQNNNLNDTEIIEEITEEAIEEAVEVIAEAPKPSKAQIILEYVEMLVLAILAVLVVFTFAFRLCQVQGGSMQNTLQNGEMVITTNIFYTPKQGDIIVFHQTSETLNEPIIKRVIATEGQSVRIDFSESNEMIIWVDGEIYEDSHAFLDPLLKHIYPKHNFNSDTLIFEAVVPEGHVFVLGDNRDNSNDSRSAEIGFVDTHRILGKAILRTKPFTWLN